MNIPDLRNLDSLDIRYWYFSDTDELKTAKDHYTSAEEALNDLQTLEAHQTKRLIR